MNTPVRNTTIVLAGALVLLALTACTTEVKPKREAIDEVLVLGDEAIADIETAEIADLEFLETVQQTCPDEEVVTYRMVARYSVTVEPGTSETVVENVHELWTDELGYRDSDNGIFWGESGYATVQVEADGAQYIATRQPDSETINIAVSTDCFEDPDEDEWVEPAVGVTPSEED